MNERDRLYPRLVEAYNGKLANIAEARSLIGEAMGAITRQQGTIERLRAGSPARSFNTGESEFPGRNDAPRNIGELALQIIEYDDWTYEELCERILAFLDTANGMTEKQA